MNVFRKDGDYAAFLKLLREANDRVPMRLLAYCLMPNHFHLVVWTFEDGDLSRWMQVVDVARTALPSALRFERSRLAGAIQGLSDRGRRPSADGVALR